MVRFTREAIRKIVDVGQSLKKLENYIEKENYIGYDPYDTLNSWMPFHWLGKWGAILAIQLQKRNPLNVRPLLGIKKEINPKAFSLFLKAYSLLYQKEQKPVYREKMDYFFNWLRRNYSRGYKGFGWGYNFPWASSQKYLDPYVPSAVVTGFISKSLFQYYEATKNENVIEVLSGAKKFVLNELPRYKDKTGLSISYTPMKKDICYNASLLAGVVLAINYYLKPNKELKNICIDLVDFVVSRQKNDGCWAYSEDIETGIQRKQIDFHQGYIIDCIYEIKKLIDIRNSRWDTSIEKGLEFYRNRQFLDNGQALWRLPKKYPVDIHNQAQGVITFSKLCHLGDQYYPFAKRILEWTINNMQSSSGYFYYQKRKYFWIKTPYIRWNQAWMFLAFATLYFHKDK